MRKTTMIAATLAAIGMGLFSGNARAEGPKKDQGYSYEFKDDALLGADLQGQTGVITVRQGGVRDRLIRPRVHFVAELLKSVEAL
jgi:hypothetical protein